MAEAHKIPLYVRFQTPRMSLAWFFWLVSFVFVIVVSCLIAYGSFAFWKKDGTYFEQPNIVFAHDLLLYVEGSTDTADTKLFYSTMPEVNTIVGYQNVRNAYVKAGSTDLNRDLMADEISINVSLPLLTGEVVNRVDVGLFFSLQLKGRVHVDMSGLLMIQHQAPQPMTAHHVYGNLVMHQQNPLSTLGIRNNYSPPVLSRSSVESIQDIRFTSLMARNFDRNESLILDNARQWTESGTDVEFSLFFKAKIPVQAIHYVPPFSETIKFGWVQLFCIGYVVHWLVELARRYIYQLQIVSTRVTTDTKTHEF